MAKMKKWDDEGAMRTYEGIMWSDNDQPIENLTPDEGAVYTNPNGAEITVTRLIGDSSVEWKDNQGDYHTTPKDSFVNMLHFNYYMRKSAKKSQSQPTSFSDMVAKQRGKNNGIFKAHDFGADFDTLADLTRDVRKMMDDACAVRDKALNVTKGPSNALDQLNDAIGCYYSALYDLEHALTEMDMAQRGVR